jgi:tetratricopeptide (TPR) repeat protein
LNCTPLAVLPIVMFALALPVHAAKPDSGQLDGNEALFTVMAAINASGYDADLASPTNHPLRKAVRDYLAGQKFESIDELKHFFVAHKQKDSSAELSQYVSYALSVDGPPDFKYKFKPVELPPDVVPLAGFSEILTKFYQEAKINEIWSKSQPAFEQAIAVYQPPVTQGLMQVNAYLRNPTSGYLGRKFQIYIDLLGAPNQIHTRSYKDDYTIVLTPSAEPQSDEVRHAYLHYLLDPLVMKYAEPLDKLRPLTDYAQGAPALEQYYKDDYFLLATECLIKAIESRLTPGAAKKQAIVDQAVREGFILTAAFAEALPSYEKQDQAFRLNFKDVIDAIGLKREVARLEKVQFVRERATKQVKIAQAERPVELVGVFRTLADAEALYKERLLDQAREAYLRVLKQPDQEGVHTKAYYGLARIASLQSDPELAERMFQKTIAMNPDDEMRAWSLVYLARLAEARDDRAQAVGNYQKALAVPGISPGARHAAEDGLKETFRKNK